MSHLIEVKNLKTEFKHEDGKLQAVNGVFLLNLNR